MNRSTLIGQELMRSLEAGFDDLAPARERWKALLQDEDPRIRIDAEKFIHGMIYPRPRDPAEDAPRELVIRYEQNWNDVRSGE